MRERFSVFCALLLVNAAAGADWPALRGGNSRDGFARAEIKPPYHLEWASEFPGERLGTAMEPIVVSGRVLAGTHAGNVYALDARTGKAVWKFPAHGAFLQSPAVAEDRVVAASADGQIYALDAMSGQLLWYFFAGQGGCSASPAIADGRVFVGTRAGEFLALSLADGKSVWRAKVGAPVRQTAAVLDGRVFVTAEDLRVRAYDAASGKALWISDQLPGQTARDYYPVMVKRDGRTHVVVRTNPTLNMGQRIGRDRTLLCRNAGVDDSGWQKVDAWIKSDAARGTPELWEREQQAVAAYLKTNADARSLFVLDAGTGRETATAPILWIAGCQGVGAMPARIEDDRLLVFYRSAYGNWNHGVAPLVALGLFDVSANKITPLFHQQGKQPRWNCFWGTADESQNFVVAGKTVLIVHQGTLSGFDLERNELFPIFGERDSYGGFRNPAWARNEWHGPGRGGVAVVGDRIYWQTGSRILCLATGEKSGAKVQPEAVSVTAGIAAPKPPRVELRGRLVTAVQEVLLREWAPLFCDPGLAGRDFSFDDNGEIFEALAWAYPHLPPELQKRTLDRLLAEWKRTTPFTSSAWYSLRDGARREYFSVPVEYCARLGRDKQPHPFANVHAAWLFGDRCKQEQLIIQAWPQIKNAFEDFLRTKWRLEPAKGDLFANRYLASLLAVQRMGEKAGDVTSASKAKAEAAKIKAALIEWWSRAAPTGTLTAFRTSAELDPYIGKGGGVSFAVAPHRHKLALFDGLTPEIAEVIRTQAPEAASQVWELFSTLYRTWPLMGEERQVHTGENFVDPPDLALGGFKVLAWLKGASPEELARWTDVPFCHADLYYIEKVAIALEWGQ